MLSERRPLVAALGTCENAYTGPFIGGIFVASGDVNGDGQAGILTTPGLGGGPLVEVFNGPDGNLQKAFNAYPPSAGLVGVIGALGATGLHAAAVDVNGDGKADLITGVGPGQRPEVQVFEAATLALLDDFFAYDLVYLGGVFVAAGH